MLSLKSSSMIRDYILEYASSKMQLFKKNCNINPHSFIKLVKLLVLFFSLCALNIKGDTYDYNDYTVWRFKVFSLVDVCALENPLTKIIKVIVENYPKKTCFARKLKQNWKKFTNSWGKLLLYHQVVKN